MGASATYSETIGTAAPKSREITTNGCPNHYSYCTGKNGMGPCGGTGNKGSDTEAMEQTKELKLPAEPILRASYGIGVANSDVQCALGAIGIAVNGVSIFGGAVNQECQPIDVDDIASEWESFDCCSGHSERTGDYHYHFPPSCLLRQVGDLPDGHSPQVGWAFDGFPIYGPKGPGGIDMKFGGSLGPCTGSHCLDECSGLEAELAGVDKFKYRYYIVGATSDLSMLPTDPKPSAEAAAQFSNGRRAFTPTCYRGYTYSELEGGATGGSGVSAGYAATPHAGVATKYAPANLCMGGGFTTAAEATNGFCSTTTKSSCHANFAGVGAPSPPPTPPPTPSTPSPPPTPPPPTPSPPPTPPPTPPTPSPPPTPPPTQTPTASPTQTPTPTPTQTPTASPTQTPTPTPTPPSSPSATPTPSPTPTPQPSPSPWSRGSADVATGQGSIVGALVLVVLPWVL